MKVLRLLIIMVFLNIQEIVAQMVEWDLNDYREQPGLIAGLADEVLVISWEGDEENQLQIKFIVADKIPVISELSVKTKSGSWQQLAWQLAPEYRVVTGVRRVTQQQTGPLEDLGIPLTEEKLNQIKWDAFWDAPLYIDDEPPRSHLTAIPAKEPFANHPGMPRKPGEVMRAEANYKVEKCQVSTKGNRLEVVFNTVDAGIFTGYLQYDFYKGSNLIRQMLVAKTDHPSAAFKYDSGLKGLPIDSNSRLIWRDIAQNWQSYRLGGLTNDQPVTVKSSNRLIAAELENGAIAAFPPPHRFYWARESEENLGYSWYQKHHQTSFSFGIRQAELELNPEFYHNFALYSARPGTWQRMPLFLYISPVSGQQAIEAALAFTNQDKFKPLPGHKVMGSHYHVGMVHRLNELGGLDHRLNDIGTMKAVGVDIYGVIDGVRGTARHDKGEAYLEELHEYYQAARSQSDRDFLVMPNDENSTSGRGPFMGGHYDIIISKPLYWRPARLQGQPLVEQHQKFGTVYNLGTPADMMEMAELENVIISMPHPNSKRSTGYPQAILYEPHFQHPHYFGLGYRWGMGIDGSEVRLGESRFLELWDQVNNQLSAQGQSLKFALAISEARSDLGERGKPPYDDVYGMSPVNYLKLDQIPSVEDMNTIVNALKNGDYFVTTGEVLIPHFDIAGTGNERTMVADIQWTFPLDFVELVSGNGETVQTQILSTSELPAFGEKRFEIPFTIDDKLWIRFAAWDVASNGAMIQPVLLVNPD